MATDVRVPTTGNAGEDAVIVAWNVEVGSAVRAGDILVVLETAKATIDVEAPIGGEVLSIRYGVGDEVPEHEVLAIVGSSGEIATDAGPARSADDPGDTMRTQPNPVVEQHTRAEAEGTPAASGGERVAASPRARVMAERRGIDLSTLTGSGPGGRIIVGDVLATNGTPTTVATTTFGLPAAPRAESARKVVPVRGARKVTAQRMHESLQSTAQVTITRYAGADALLAYAGRLRTATEARGLPKIGVNDLLLFAAARTVARHPAANSWFSWEGITQFDCVDLGFAVDTGQALLVPVIRDADTLSLLELASSASEAIARARAGKLAAADMEGGTFTISNLGSLGVHWFTPVLNPPQSCIIGVGATHQLHPDGPALLPLSLTFDHRAIDGAAAAALLADIASAIEAIDVLAAL